MKKRAKNLALIYTLLWVVVFMVLTFLFSRRERSIADSALFFFEMAFNSNFLIGFHVLFVLVYSLFLTIKHFIKVSKNKGRNIAIKQFLYRCCLPLLMLFVGFKTIVFINAREWHHYDWDTSVINKTGYAKDLYEKDKKQRGISVFGWSNDNSKAIDDLVKNNVEWVAVIPFIDQKDENSDHVRAPNNLGIYSRRDSNMIRAINDLHAKNLRVHLKPHLWLRNGWRSNISLSNKTEWDTWFNSYRVHMLRYAKMAQDTKAELFCIGTELKTSIKNQPEKWELLIKEIRDIYDGKLTYAANWHDEYEHITFWDQLDYIGIQAYFPLTKEENPSLETIEKGWDKHLKALENVHKKYGKPILFTEVGYKSTLDATIKPWEWSSYLSKLSEKKSDMTQQLAYEAMFKKNWNKPWFAGIYIWQWHTRTTRESAETDLDFSPRFKPAENVIAKWFAQSSNTNKLNKISVTEN
ncbi:hypothetical protein J8L85_09875 [Maribacter sp. MMG018]|uniref:glycoside hydrolase family 113 n=1 Tax=Maribacter sp. MMG018 TaxID=2822688 RepID=UPI001B37A64D|nr:hypothetical protein [Maribacter sp. MMG018]MBQ4914743.1 hypothetical protein [Maribacter sp. MMG018]